LALLIGFGRRLFDPERHGSLALHGERPAGLVYLEHPRPAFPQLPWATSVGENLGQSDLCLQLTGGNDAAVNRACVELWKLLVDSDHPLQARSMFTGFGRSDGRGWLEFHDGVSNLVSSQRQLALTARPDPGWMGGGTYMAFLRIAVNLSAWRQLTRTEQELIVGRDKLSGAPLTGVKRDEAGRVTPIAAPVADEMSSDVERAAFHDPPQTTELVLEASHIHRANQNRASAAAPGALRIFRQGYDFLDDIGAGGPGAGLNFVSFQSDLLTLQSILHLPGWLADVNFGGSADPGPGEPEQRPLLSLLAGGFYAVPPVSEPCPGAELFDAR
jgi:deferrochelatase/peroxidase EfeB